MSQRWNRRAFVRTVMQGAAAGWAAPSLLAGGSAVAAFRAGSVANPTASPVSLVKGNDRRANMLKALEPLTPTVRQALNGRQVVIKPNLTRVKPEDALASTHVDAVGALCEMFASFYDREIIIAEGTGPGTPLDEALDNYGYRALARDFNVRFVDLQQDDYIETYIQDREFNPLKLRVSKLLSDPGNYVVSAAVMKTHSLAAVTLGLKNVVMAAPMNFGEKGSDRSKMHQDRVDENPRCFNYNLFQMARLVAPDLVAIDGFVGMQGEGPLNGDPIESKVALAGTDWLATDRVGVEIMGVEFARLAHYRHCWKAGMGEADLQKIEIVGSTIGECRMPYQPPASIEKILL